MTAAAARPAGERSTSATPRARGEGRAGEPVSQRLRVTPIPRREPPRISADEAFDTRVPDARYVQETLALSGPPDPVAPRRGRPDPDDYFERQPTASHRLPAPHVFARRIGQALVEVMWGVRPATQVVRWTSAEVHAVVARRSLVAVRRGLRGGRPPVVTRLRVCEPADGVAEVALVVVAGGRVRAMALRLEGLDGRWVVTELQVG